MSPRRYRTQRGGGLKTMLEGEIVKQAKKRGVSLYKKNGEKRPLWPRGWGMGGGQKGAGAVWDDVGKFAKTMYRGRHFIRDGVMGRDVSRSKYSDKYLAERGWRRV